MEEKIIKEDKGYLDSFDIEQKKREAEEMAQQQESEQMLYNYIISSACFSETPLAITKQMSQYLGLPQKLPAGRLLQAANMTGIDPAAQLALFSKTLAESDLFPDLRTYGDLDETEKHWISIHSDELSLEESLEDMEREKWRETNVSPPKVKSDSKKTKPRRFLLIVGVAIFCILAYKGGSCSPQKVMHKLGLFPKKQSQEIEDIPLRSKSAVRQKSSIAIQEEDDALSRQSEQDREVPQDNKASQDRQSEQDREVPQNNKASQDRQSGQDREALQDRQSEQDKEASQDRQSGQDREVPQDTVY